MKFAIVKNNHLTQLNIALDGIEYRLKAGAFTAIPEKFVDIAIRAGRIEPLKPSKIERIKVSDLPVEDVKKMMKEHEDIMIIETASDNAYSCLFDGMIHEFKPGKKYVFPIKLAKVLISRSYSAKFGKMLRVVEIKEEKEKSIIDIPKEVEDIVEKLDLEQEELEKVKDVVVKEKPIVIPNAKIVDTEKKTSGKSKKGKK